MLTCVQNAEKAVQLPKEQIRKAKQQRLQDDAIIAESNLISFVSSVCVSGDVDTTGVHNLCSQGLRDAPSTPPRGKAAKRRRVLCSLL